MIIRISTEGQYELDETERQALDELDNATVHACEAGDEPGFHETFERLLTFIRDKGRRVPDDELAGSDLILPPPDVTLAEAAAEFSGEGLLPG